MDWHILGWVLTIASALWFAYGWLIVHPIPGVEIRSPEERKWLNRRYFAPSAVLITTGIMLLFF